jgi:hypothetical protein
MRFSSASLAISSSKVMTWVSAPNWVATSLTSSASSDWLTVTKTPRISSEAIRSLPRTPSFSARSFTLMPSVTVMVRVMGTGSWGICAPPKRGGGAKPFIGPSLVLGYCWRPRRCCGAASAAGELPLEAGSGRLHHLRRAGARQSRGARQSQAAVRQSRAVHRGREVHPGWVRVGCMGRRAPPGPSWGGGVS